MRRVNAVPAVFLVLSGVALYYSDLSPAFVAGEVVTRFIRDGVMVLALVVPVTAGMGLNFAVTVGALAAQVGMVLAVDWGLQGGTGLLAITAMGLALSLVFGCIIGAVLNLVRGKEMIATMIIGFLATGLYQLVFMVGYGTFIKPTNREMMLSRGIGIRNMVDLEPFRNIMDRLWVVQAGPVEIPLFMVLVVLAFACVIAYLMNTPLGQQFKAVGEGYEKARMLGIDADAVRVKAIVLSTVLACLGHIIFTQNIGMLNVYTAHMNTDIFACAALLAGGASILRAHVGHALLGVLLFHSLFIVSPQAGQNIFANAALGEYFRTFVAYGTIAFALVMSTGKR
ncbi:MAG TPA: ABC transporter permease [Deltaproteobacteria bacterium]|nr:ABC transporter permease [Deltaproteobacteria bacterium]HPR54662.1 ABC transporter permease [Deltaproteobacteria bacterium]HXK47206.1 ABC transporter permease [Deltaproteobacteria bacterium]